MVFYLLFCLSAVCNTDAAINVVIYELGNDVIVESEAGTVTGLPSQVPDHMDIDAAIGRGFFWTGGSNYRRGYGGSSASNGLVFSGDMFSDNSTGTFPTEAESTGPSIGFRFDESWHFVFFDSDPAYDPYTNFPGSYSRWANTSIAGMGFNEGSYTISLEGSGSRS